MQKITRSAPLQNATSRYICALCATLFIHWGAHASNSAAGIQIADLTSVPLENLLNIEVQSASRYPQKMGDAPSFVSVVTSKEIKTFGWRTLAEILRSMPGLYITNDRSYSYLGARGFLRSGDYNPRFLLTIDGVRVNEPTYDQAMIGSEFVLDVDLIDRVEYAPGPGSSVYGSNAFFGVINVITKRARDFNGVQVATEVGSAGLRKGRATIGLQGESGSEILLSATSSHTDGRDLRFPEFPGQVARRMDYERAQSVFAKGSAGPFSFSLTHSERSKGTPTASYSQDFGDPRSRTVDNQTLFNLGYNKSVFENTDLTATLFANQYEFQGVYAYAPVLNIDRTKANWWGGELKLVSNDSRYGKLIIGLDYQKSGPISQRNFDAPPDYLEILNLKSSNSRLGIFAHSEISLHKDLLLNAGLRYDKNSVLDKDALNPRLGLIYKLSPATSVKLLYGRSYRVPNVYELYYEYPGDQKPNPGLQAEKIASYEVGVEHRLSPESRVRISAFCNKVNGLITQARDPDDGLLVFQNMDKATATGIEGELLYTWQDGTRLRTSLSWQDVKGDATGETTTNAPKYLGKLNLSTPFYKNIWRAGLEVQYVAARNTLLNRRLHGYTLANLTLFSDRLLKGLEFSASIHNLLNHRYADPVGPEFLQDALLQDGRTIRVKLSYSFN